MIESTKSTQKNQTDAEHLAQFSRTHSILRPPRFKSWHGLRLVYVLGTLFAQQRTPGLLSDLGARVVCGWEASVLIRVSIILLMIYAMFLVRGLHWLTYGALLLSVSSLSLQLGDIRITHEPLTLSFALALAAYTFFTVRLITRQPEMSTSPREP